jgi:hypothetical protein
MARFICLNYPNNVARSCWELRPPANKKARSKSGPGWFATVLLVRLFVLQASASRRVFEFAKRHQHADCGITDQEINADGEAQAKEDGGGCGDGAGKDRRAVYIFHGVNGSVDNLLAATP